MLLMMAMLRSGLVVAAFLMIHHVAAKGKIPDIPKQDLVTSPPVFHTTVFHSLCDVTEFECCNGNCIGKVLANNTFNDCGDNSDEAEGECCTREGDFHCLEGSCIPMDYYLDGVTDCIAGDDPSSSDEAKHIGLDCTASLDPERCCQCEVYMAHSECRDDGDGYKCHCQPGYYANSVTLRECIMRQIGDSCVEDADCNSVMNNTICVSPENTCDCLDGWFYDGQDCQKRELGSDCEKDSDCWQVIDNSVCRAPDLVCDCDDWWYPEGGRCIRRMSFVGFRVRRTTDLTPAANVIFDYDTEDFNYQSVFNMSSSKFSAPANGIYEFSFIIGNTVTCGIQLLVNGVSMEHVYQNDAVNQQPQSGNTLLRLDEGDEAWLLIQFISADSFINCTPYSCMFTGRLVHQEV